MTRVLVALLISAVTATPCLFAAPLKTLTGDAVVTSIDERRIAFLLDSNGDEKVDHGFLLTSDLPLPTNLKVRLAAARLQFTGGYARLAGEQQVFDLHVAGYPEPPATPAESRVFRYSGYALIQSNGDAGCDIAKALENASACFAYGE